MIPGSCVFHMLHDPCWKKIKQTLGVLLVQFLKQHLKSAKDNLNGNVISVGCSEGLDNAVSILSLGKM